MKNKIIVVLLILAVVITVILVFVWRKNNVERWNEVACETFKEALNEDLKSRSDLKVECHGGRELMSVATKNPKNVFVTSQYGRREYKIDSCKHVNNVTFDGKMRSVHSIVLEKYPLDSDTIEAIWKRCLSNQNIMASTGVRISVTDLDYHTTSEFSKTFGHKSLKDSLVSCYVGYRCEVEVTGFINYAWLSNMAFEDIFVFVVPLLIIVILYVIGFLFRDKIEKYFMKEVPVIVQKEVPVIIEKEILVVTTEQNQFHIYRLPDGTLFNFDDSSLKNDGHREHLSNQNKTLLRAFVEAENNRLTFSEIMSLLWPKGNGTPDTVHQAVSRLRSILEKVSKMTLINEDCAYQLKSPISSKNNSVL